MTTQAVTLHLPGDTLQRYKRSASLARKSLEEFLTERLIEFAPPPVEESFTRQDDLSALERLDDQTLWEIARSQLPKRRQQAYDRLLRKNSEGNITEEEKARLHAIGDEARRLMLKKAHAYLLLKQRGYTLPSLDELAEQR